MTVPFYLSIGLLFWFTAETIPDTRTMVKQGLLRDDKTDSLKWLKFFAVDLVYCTIIPSTILAFGQTITEIPYKEHHTAQSKSTNGEPNHTIVQLYFYSQLFLVLNCIYLQYIVGDGFSPAVSYATR